MKYHFLILILFTTFSLAAQKKFMASLDTTINAVNPYIQEYTTATFWKQSFVKEAIDINNPNVELLEAVVFFEINRFRVQKKKTALQYHAKLDKLAENYVTYYGSNVFNNRHTSVFNKSIVKSSKAMKFYGGFQGVCFGITYLLQHRKGKPIFTKTIEGERKFYIGKAKAIKKRGKNAKLIPVPTLTYAQWAKIMRRKLIRKSYLRDKSFTELGCAIQVVDNNPKAVPRVKVMVILGGYRLQLLSVQK